MKKANFSLAAIIVGIAVMCQSTEVSVNPHEITIPINTKVLVSSVLDGSTIGNFKLIEQWPVEAPLDMMDLLDGVERVDYVSSQFELMFCQAETFGNRFVILTTTNRFEKSMMFEAKFKIAGKKGFFETKINIKYPGVYSIEQWRDDLESIVLYDFRLIED